jgi:hypothetical protein
MSSNIEAYSVGYRWYLIMFSQDGLAFHNEYSISKTQGMSPLCGTGFAPQLPTAAIWSNSALARFDLAIYF